MKKSAVLAMAFAFAFSMALSAEQEKAGVSSSHKKESVGMEKKEHSNVHQKKAPQVFTLEKLAQFDGKEGRPAYVAVDGIVYDVTGVPAWASGEHKTGKAGTDISEKIKLAPHGKAILSKRTKVGVLAGTNKRTAESQKKTERNEDKKSKQK
jgi:predicted heme/steroid binding protein